MDFAGIVDIALPVVYVLVGAVLVWFVVELALTIRSTRSTIDDAHKELTPTLKNVEKITAQVDPLIAHVDALVTDQIDPLLTRVNEIAEEAKPPWAASIRWWSVCRSRWTRRIWNSCASTRFWKM